MCLLSNYSNNFADIGINIIQEIQIVAMNNFLWPVNAFGSANGLILDTAHR